MIYITEQNIQCAIYQQKFYRETNDSKLITKLIIKKGFIRMLPLAPTRSIL